MSEKKNLNLIISQLSEKTGRSKQSLIKEMIDLNNITHLLLDNHNPLRHDMQSILFSKIHQIPDNGQFLYRVSEINKNTFLKLIKKTQKNKKRKYFLKQLLLLIPYLTCLIVSSYILMNKEYHDLFIKWLKILL